MMKASYYCGLRMFEEFVCVEHEGFARRKAEKWWRERRGSSPLTAGQLPERTSLALELAEHLQTASHLRVWTNKKYPEILAYCFDGTAFGEQPAGAAPTVQSFPSKSAPAAPAMMADDIPF